MIDNREMIIRQTLFLVTSEEYLTLALQQHCAESVISNRQVIYDSESLNNLLQVSQFTCKIVRLKPRTFWTQMLSSPGDQQTPGNWAPFITNRPRSETCSGSSECKRGWSFLPSMLCSACGAPCQNW